jgi:hypothetical protein
VSLAAMRDEALAGAEARASSAAYRHD